MLRVSMGQIKQTLSSARLPRSCSRVEHDTSRRTPGGPGGMAASLADVRLAAHHPILDPDNARHILGGDA